MDPHGLSLFQGFAFCSKRTDTDAVPDATPRHLYLFDDSLLILLSQVINIPQRGFFASERIEQEAVVSGGKSGEKTDKDKLLCNAQSDLFCHLTVHKHPLFRSFKRLFSRYGSQVAY